MKLIVDVTTSDYKPDYEWLLASTSDYEWLRVNGETLMDLEWLVTLQARI